EQMTESIKKCTSLSNTPPPPRKTTSREIKPASYPNLVALALKSSPTGYLLVCDIYNFICDNFPYFRTANPVW
ncbi:hypothetical protein PENTCL1PPCAC_26020, partial [Pristionchus entomophagus]